MKHIIVYNVNILTNCAMHNDNKMNCSVPASWNIIHRETNMVSRSQSRGHKRMLKDSAKPFLH